MAQSRQAWLEEHAKGCNLDVGQCAECSELEHLVPTEPEPDWEVLYDTLASWDEQDRAAGAQDQR
jgi:hypothetical protein